VVGFDGDSAGRESSFRVALAALHKGSEVIVTVLRDGDDPATFLAKHGCAGLAAFVRQGTLKAGAGAPQPVHVGCFLAETAIRDGVDPVVVREMLLKAGARLANDGARWRFSQQVTRVLESRSVKSDGRLRGTPTPSAEASRTVGRGTLASEGSAFRGGDLNAR
jgi:hypothetical protein